MTNNLYTCMSRVFDLRQSYPQSAGFCGSPLNECNHVNIVKLDFKKSIYWKRCGLIKLKHFFYSTLTISSYSN